MSAIIRRIKGMKRSTRVAIIIGLIAAFTAFISSNYHTSDRAEAAGDGYLLKRQPAELCGGCHNLPIHNTTNTSPKYGTWGGNFTCLTCHQPHNTTNIYLVAPVIATPNSGNKNVSFQDVTIGDSNTTNHLSFVNSAAGSNTQGVCQVCHTQTAGNGTQRWRNTGNGDASHYQAGGPNGTQACINCHLHKNAFAKESKGGMDCSTCHADIFNPLNGTTGYHHYLNNAGVSNLASGSKYPVINQPATLGNTTDANRRCLMCHADHDIFRPDINSSNTTGRSANLRTDISALPSTTANYTNTDFLNSGNGGVCLSCHQSSQTKSYTQPDSTTATPVIATTPSVFNASAHQYTVPSTFATDSSTFNANCSKCHNDNMNPKSSVESSGLGESGSANKFGLHQSTLRRIEATLGITSPTDPLEEQFCYRCHSKTTDTGTNMPAKTVANKDWYGVANMSGKSEAIYSIFNTKTYKHPVNTISGIHKPGDGSAYNDGSLTGTNRHAECEDCHNPHAAEATTALYGVSGVTISNPTTQFTDLTSSNYTYASNASVTATQSDGTTKINLDYKLCLKCHSNWAYGASSNAPNPTASASWQQTNMAMEFNINNYSYHYVEGNISTAAALPSNGSGCNSYGPNAGSTQIPRASTSYGNFNTTYVGVMEPTLAGLTDTQRRAAKLRCSSCHGIDGASSGTTPEGPHGSAYAFILKVPSGSSYTTWNNSVSAYSGNVWCFNCHDPNNFTNFSNTGTGFSGMMWGNLHYLHSYSHNRACQYCHVAIPHGWKRYRFIRFEDCESAPYVGKTGGLSSGIIWATSGTWSESYCHGQGAVGSCG